MEVARPVEPGIRNLVCDLYYQGVAIPMPFRKPHPAISGGVHVRSIHINRSARSSELISDENMVAGLNDLKRKWHVGCPGYAWHEAFPGRVEVEAIVI